MRLQNALLICLCLLASASFAGEPVVTFGSDSIEASGLTPRNDVVYLGAARIASGYTRHMATGAERLADSDGDGRVQLRSGLRVPLHSVWIVVDLATGASSVVTPHPDGPALTREKLKMGELRHLARGGDYLMFFLIRPGEGAWSLVIDDSGIRDADGVGDRNVSLAIERMQPIGNSAAPPDKLRKTDVVFVVDPMTLTVVEMRDE